MCTAYDESRVYVGGTAANGCHRSDVAEVLSARIDVDRGVNLACSGAVTQNLLRSSSGGTSAHGEAPQADQLAAVARSSRIRMIVVSIGGNDFGVASIVTACFEAYLAHARPCSQTQAAAVDRDRVDAVTARIGHAIDEIRAVIGDAGYRKRAYRLVLQTCPVVIPHAADARYREADPRRTVQGCPFYDADVDWAQDVAAPRIGTAVTAAARSRGAEVLELLPAFAGHEVCARQASSVTPLTPQSPVGSEWGRAVSPSAIVEGQTQELFHPTHTVSSRSVTAWARCIAPRAARTRAPVAPVAGPRSRCSRSCAEAPGGGPQSAASGSAGGSRA